LVVFGFIDHASTNPDRRKKNVTPVCPMDTSGYISGTSVTDAWYRTTSMAAMNRSPVSESSRAREMVFPP
jgi:hypothetical protein